MIDSSKSVEGEIDKDEDAVPNEKEEVDGELSVMVVENLEKEADKSEKKATISEEERHLLGSESENEKSNLVWKSE